MIHVQANPEYLYIFDQTLKIVGNQEAFRFQSSENEVNGSQSARIITPLFFAPLGKHSHCYTLVSI